MKMVNHLMVGNMLSFFIGNKCTKHKFMHLLTPLTVCQGAAE